MKSELITKGKYQGDHATFWLKQGNAESWNVLCLEGNDNIRERTLELCVPQGQEDRNYKCTACRTGG